MITFDAQLNGSRFSQYINFPFNSMVRFGERFLGASSAGLFEIGADKDNGTNIAAEFEFPTTDLGVHNKKRIRFIYLGYETTGDLEFEVITDQQPGKVYRVTKVNKQGQQRNRFPVQRTQQGRYLALKVRNINGSDFGVDRVEVLPIVLSSGITR